MKFSIIVVCLNPGSKLNETLDSILSQSCSDYEIIVKDGGSRDGSIENMRQSSRIRLYQEKDAGIYDAMNQAVSYAEGEYILFLNCGDVFYDDKVLEKTAECMKQYAEQYAEQCAEQCAEQYTEQHKQSHGSEAVRRKVFYGDTFSAKNQVVIASSPKITGFTCYRNIPCHQVCFYEASLCKEKPYDLQYRIRADYDHFLWCYYVAKADMVHMDVLVASYEGGGFSEKKENVKKDKREHRTITKTYMSSAELLKYRTIMLVSLAPLRRVLAENPVLGGMYHKLKEWIYSRK